MDVEFLLVGQGISGSFLSMELLKEGRSFVVIDDGRPCTASRVASGIINPVTGRRIVKTWMIDELIPFAQDAYKEMGESLGINCIRETRMVDFFPTPQMRLAFFNRLEEDPHYLAPDESGICWDDFVRYDFGNGTIGPCFLVDVASILNGFRERLGKEDRLRQEVFEWPLLELKTNGVRYKELRADKLIFCDGVTGMTNPWFRNLPFAPNKGEALIIEVRGLPKTHILKKGINLVPIRDDLFWAGSSHEWQFSDEAPSSLFREKTLAQLKQFLKLPFTCVDHWAAVRPATLERRPFIGLHPLQPSLGIFNGMGTKGCSLAPYFARHMVDHLTQNSPLLPEVDVRRFRRVLEREL